MSTVESTDSMIIDSGSVRDLTKIDMYLLNVGSKRWHSNVCFLNDNTNRMRDFQF